MFVRQTKPIQDEEVVLRITGFLQHYPFAESIRFPWYLSMHHPRD